MFPLLLIGGGAGLAYLLFANGSSTPAGAGTAMPGATRTTFDPSQSIDPSGSSSSLPVVGSSSHSCRNNNRECPAAMHCHNATGLCVPWPTDKACHLHGCEIGESTQDCAGRLGIPMNSLC